MNGLRTPVNAKKIHSKTQFLSLRLGMATLSIDNSLAALWHLLDAMDEILQLWLVSF
jgi:hypothetical protein